MSPRRELDRYLTRRSWDVEQLLENVDISGSVMELCCGEKDIVKVIDFHKPANRINIIYTNDIDHKMNPDYCLDAADPNSYLSRVEVGRTLRRFPTVDWHVTNPPYTLAPKIIPLAFEHARVGIAMLLRLTYLEPCTKSRNRNYVKRGLWLKDHPPTDLLVLPRYSYTGDGKTDSVTSAWMVWDKRLLMIDQGCPRYQRILCIPEPPPTHGELI